MPAPNAFFAAMSVVVGLFAAPAEAQGPPPPVRYDGPPVVEGYNVAVLYQRWTHWIESRKGEVMEAAAARPERPEGRLRRGSALLEARARGDLGQVLVADISIFCPAAADFQETHDCGPRMREITIPSRADGYGGEDALALWARQTFDPAAIVVALKSAGITPETDPWRIEVEPIFSDMASPVEVLQSQLRVRAIDGRDCPAMVEALNALEGQTLGWPIDLWGFGTDEPLQPPRPHAAHWSYKVRFLADGFITIDAGPALTATLSPAFAAGETCLNQRRG